MHNMPYIVNGLSDSDMVWLLSMGKLKPLAPGERLVEAGRPVDDLFFIMRGTLAVLLADDTLVTTLTEGDVVGEMSFVDQRPPSASVRADEVAEVLAIPRKKILKRFDQEPVFAARFYRALAVFLSERLRETTAAAHAPDQDAAADENVKAASDRFRRLAKKLKPKAG